MPTNRRTSNEYLEPERAKNMGSIEARNGIKRQQDSKINEAGLLPHRTQRNSQTRVSQRTGKSSGDCQDQNVKSTATKNDELVRYMSNLPKYLQHVAKQDNSGANPLNVGVLDWGRLEKWKHTRKDSPTRGRNNVSSKSSSSSSRTAAKPVSLPSTGPGYPKAYKRKQSELSKKVSQNSESDDKRSNSLPLKMTAKSCALPSKVPDGSLSVKSKQLEVKKKELQDSKIADAHHQPGDLKNIVLLRPKRSARESTLVECPELSDGTLTKAKPEDELTEKSVKTHSEASRSGPTFVPTKCDSEEDMMTQGLEPLSDLSHSSFNSENKGSSLMPSKSQKRNKVESENASNETLRVLDQEMAELANKRNRNQSGHHRFSFSLNLSRMSRSFSFKEGSDVQQSSSSDVSVKSGPVGSDASGCFNDINIEKVKAQNRTRSSPLRRMLDLRKPKSLNSLGFGEVLEPLKGSLSSSNLRPTSASESFKKEKHEPSTIQALMQLTLKDGLPLFRFVVNNSNNILAASMKIPTSSVGDDMVQNYTFYSVNEVKKKIGSWISQGSKEKSCGYSYDVIGQMKISSSNIPDAKDFNNDSLIRESVLFGVDHQQQATQISQKLNCNIELAAAVIKTPKDEDSNSTIVILPGAIHGLPNKGLPSPLIHRWRSGGSCDCGGWDIGCKLRILSNQNGITCPASLNPDCVELFVQGETRPLSRPIFSLALHKHGLYTIEFNSSLSALQAFFISMTVLCCQKSSDLVEASSLSKAKVLESVLNSKGSDGIETKPTMAMGKMPVKYTPIPPLSPVGRV